MIEVEQLDKGNLALQLLLPQKGLNGLINFAQLLIKHGYLTEATQIIKTEISQSPTSNAEAYIPLGEIEIKKKNTCKQKNFIIKRLSLILKTKPFIYD